MTIHSDSNKPSFSIVLHLSKSLFLDSSFLFIISLLLSLIPYIRSDSTFPIGHDTIHYIAHMFRAERTGIDYFISGGRGEPYFYHPGYILIAVLTQKITGATFFDIGRFLPIIASSILAVVFYHITFTYTNNRMTSLLSGFLVSIFPGRMRLTRDLHSNLFAYLFFLVAVLFFLYFLKSSSNNLSSRQKWAAIGFIILSVFTAYTHIHVFLLAVSVSIAFSTFLFIKRLIQPSAGHILKKSLVALSPIIIALAIAGLLLLILPETLITRLSVEVEFTQRMDLPSPPSLYDLFFGAEYPFGSLGLLHIWGREIIGTYSNLDLFNSTLMSSLMILGVLTVFHRGLIKPKNSSEWNMSAFLFAWFAVNFALIFSGLFGFPFVKAAFIHRASLLLPIPIFAAIGLQWIIHGLKRFPIRTLMIRFHSVSHSTILIPRIIIILLLIGTLVPTSYYAVKYSEHSQINFYNWEEELGSKLEQLAAWRAINRPDRMPIFITVGEWPWSLDVAFNSSMFNTMRQEYEWMLEIYSNELKFLPDSFWGTCLIYYGELRYLQQGTYTSYQGWRDELSLYYWNDFLSRLEPYELEKCDVYIITSIYRKPFDMLGITLEILPGIFLLNSLTW